MEADVPIAAAELVESFFASSKVVGAAQRHHLALIVACDAARVWEDDCCRDVAQWVALRDGISTWKAQRLVDAGYALERLPSIALALENGILSLDKVVELSRFATADDEDEPIEWAKGVAPGDPRAGRRRAPRLARRSSARTGGASCGGGGRTRARA